MRWCWSLVGWLKGALDESTKERLMGYRIWVRDAYGGGLGFGGIAGKVR